MVSDENILEAFRNSDDEGYRILMDVYGNYVYTIVTDKVRGMASEQDKEECIADIFIETARECRELCNTVQHFRRLFNGQSDHR